MTIDYTENADYTNISTSLTYLPSLETNQTICVNITILEDGILEDNEEFSVVLSSIDVTVLAVFPRIATVSIIDNDGREYFI